MDTKTLKPGDLVIVGKRNDVREGRRGTKAIFLARGNYTTVPTPCGQALKPYQYCSRPRIAIAAQCSRWNHDKGVREEVWELELKDSSAVYEYHEYNMRANRIAKMQRDHDKWQEERTKQIEQVNGAFHALTRKLGVPDAAVEEIYVRTRRKAGSRRANGEYEYVDAFVGQLGTVLDALVARPYVASLVRAYREATVRLKVWETANPDPATCPLP